jgi:hypothetical protein
MNYRQRIMRLTNKAGGFCNCKQTVKTETYIRDLTSDSDNPELRLLGRAVPDICPDCKRPIEKEVSTFQLEDEQ